MHVQKMRLVHELPLDKLEKKITKTLTQEYKKLLIQEIQALFGNHRTITINNRYKDQRYKISEKDKIVYPKFKFDPNKLTAYQIGLYNRTWCKTSIVKIANNGGNYTLEIGSLNDLNPP